MQKHCLLFVLLLFASVAGSYAQMGDPEYLANAEHALLNYQNCEATEGNLRKVSLPGQNQPLYLLLKGKHAEICKKNTDSALHYYSLYLRKNPSDQSIQSAYKVLIQKKRDEEKKKDCHWCKGTGYYEDSEKCSQCNGKRYTGTETCSKCEGTGKRDCTFCEDGVNACKQCEGSGCRACNGRGGFYCSVCNGAGDRGQCHYCWGKGKKEVRCTRCDGDGRIDVRTKCTSHP